MLADRGMAVDQRSFCQRCHLIHDRPHHLTNRRITYLLRCALGDLFLGPYSSDRRTTRDSSRFRETPQQ
jgi:hypothetical protein